jgi:5'-methylthioadenosine phosphorylase
MTNDRPTAKLAVIGGSGFYDMPGLSDVEHWHPTTPFGDPSDEIVIGTLQGKRVAFLPRHGVGHRLMPHEIPVRANIWALKALGVQGILAVSAVGSLKQEIVPGHMVVPDQIIDRTRGNRPTTFFGDGIVVHVGFADPFCSDLSARLVESAGRVGRTAHATGTYIAMEGPLFSTRAESHLYRSWGASIIGMTAVPEAKLAREAEIAYAMLATATDYDVWHEAEADVTAAAVAEIVAQNVQSAQSIIADLTERLPDDWTSTAAGALFGAIMTDSRSIPAETLDRYALLIEGRLP